MDTQDPPKPVPLSAYKGLIGLDNEKDAMMSCCLDSTMLHLANAQYCTGLTGGSTGCLFLMFGGPVYADRISNCPLDRILTYRNLIYLLNLQIHQLLGQL